jgi:hypothetical protein
VATARVLAVVVSHIHPNIDVLVDAIDDSDVDKNANEHRSPFVSLLRIVRAPWSTVSRPRVGVQLGSTIATEVIDARRGAPPAPPP